MPDHWSYVIAAYLVAAVALGGYWRRLSRIDRELERRDARWRKAR